MEKCKNCENLENGSIIKLDNDGNCPFCNRNISRFYPASDLNQTNKEIENSQKDIKSGYLGEEGDDVLVYTTNQTNNRIREEWRGWAFNHKQHLGRMCDRKEIEDYWLSKIAELLKSQREELVNKIEKHQNFITMSDYDVGYNDCKENIINLIKNN